MKKNKIISVVAYAALGIVMLFLLLPIVWVFITSIKTNMEAYRFPPTFIPEVITFDSYKQVLNGSEFLTYYKNNFVVSFVVAAITTLVALFSGYALARFNFKWNKYIVALLVSAQMFPVIGRLISLYVTMKNIGLLNTTLGLELALVATTLPFSVLLMSGFLNSVPREIEEAAIVDGAGKWETLFKLVLPLVKPGVVAVGIYTFLMTWDDYLHCMILITEDKLRTLSVGLALRYLGELSYDWSLVNAISVLGTIPILILFFFFQKHMVKGLVAGAVKG